MTIKDVADLAGVSITTVSHVINETRFVSDELTHRVQTAMEELNYRPNYLARSLRSGESKTIGLVIPDISNLFFAEISRKIEDMGFVNGYSVILCNTDDDPEKEAAYINVLLEKQVDGIIFISAGEDGENLSQLQKFNVPIVVVDRNLDKIEADVVLVDNKLGGYLATKYLIELGHRKIACIKGPSILNPSAQRFEGYKQALDENMIDLNNSVITTGDFRVEGGERAMQELLERKQEITAVFVCNDMMAMGAMRAVYNHGLAIPEDISIVGFDNIPITESVYPSLTTISQPVGKMAELIVHFLKERISQENNRRKETQGQIEYRHTVLEVELIKRESCKIII